MNAHAAIACLCLLLASALPAHHAGAGELSAVINGKSFHLDSRRDWNERNYGLGLEYQFDSHSRWKTLLMVSGFRDSQSNMSFMAGGGLHRNLFNSEQFSGLYVDLGLNVFMMTRENIDNGKPFPGALPSLTIGNRYVGTNVTYLPRAAISKVVSSNAMDPHMSGIVFMQLKINLTELLARR